MPFAFEDSSSNVDNNRGLSFDEPVKSSALEDDSSAFENNSSNVGNNRGLSFDEPVKPYAYTPHSEPNDRIKIGNEIVKAPNGVGKALTDISNDNLFDSPPSSADISEETLAQFEKQAVYVALVAHTLGLVDGNNIADFIADRSRALAYAQAKQPQYMKQFRKELDADTGFFHTFATAISHPRALGRMIVTNSANSVIPILSTFAGTKAGGAAAAPASAAALTIPVVGAPLAGLIQSGGAVGGGAIGAFHGSMIVEVGSQIDELIGEAGYDTTDAAQLIAALDNTELMESIKEKAINKGLSTSAVDALFQLVGGKVVRKVLAGGGGKAKVIAGAVADVGIQSVGEGLGEAAGQYARDGKVDINEAVLEGMTSLGQSVGQTAVGVTVGQTKKAGSKVVDKVIAKRPENIENEISNSNDANEIAVDIIKDFEGYSDEAYYDVNAFRAGHGSDTTTLEDGTVVAINEDSIVTPEDSERDVKRRSAMAMDTAKKQAGSKWQEMSPKQQAVLTSISYNYGSLPKRITKVIESGGDVAAAIRALGGDNKGINKKRRNKEAKIYENGFVDKQGGEKNLKELETSIKKRQAKQLTLSKKIGQAQKEVTLIESELNKAKEGLTDAEVGDVQAVIETIKSTKTGRKPQSLIGWLEKEHGGIYDERGELDALGVKTKGKAPSKSTDMSGARVGKGIHIDDAALYAWEAGYLPEFNQRPTAEEFKQVLANSNGGKDRFNSESYNNAIAVLQDADEVIGGLGLSYGEGSKISKLTKRLQEKLDVADSNLQSRVINLDNIKEEVKKLQKYLRSLPSREQLAKLDIKQAQAKVTDVIQNSGISLHERGKFISIIKKIDSVDKLFKQLPNIEERIQKAFDRDVANAHKKAVNKVKMIMKSTAVEKSGGKPKGKFTAEYQDLFDSIRPIILKMSTEDAANQLEKNFESYSNGAIPSLDESMVNSALSLVAGGSSVEDVMEFSEAIAAIKRQGIKASSDKRIKRMVLANSIIDESLPVVNQGREDNWIGESPERKTALIKLFGNVGDVMTSAWNGNLHWENIIDKLMVAEKKVKGKSSGMYSSNLSKLLRVSQIENQEKGIIRKEREAVNKLYSEVYGLDTKKKTLRKIKDDTYYTLPEKTFIDGNGKKVHMNMTRSMLRKRYMEFLDPTLRETLTSPKGNAWTMEMVSWMNETLTSEDKKFALGQIEYYKSFYKKINKKYRDIYGVSLPFNEFYSPIQRKGVSTEGKDVFSQDAKYRRSVGNGSMISRVANLRPIAETSDLGVINQHIVEMGHFLAWSDRIRDITAVMSNVKFREAIIQSFGNGMMRQIDAQIDNFISGRIANSDASQSIINILRRNFVMSVIPLKPAIALKQLMSIPAYGAFVPTKDFSAGLIDFAKNPKKAIKILSKSELMIDRSGGSLTRDMMEAVQSDEWATFTASPTFRNRLMFITRWGDKAAIYAGGWTAYNYKLKKTGDHNKAMAFFEQVTTLTQQSADLSMLNSFQRGSPLVRSLTMFMSAPIAYMNMEVAYVRNFLAGRITTKQFAKGFMIFHVILPQMFTAISNMGWEDEEQLYTLIGGNLGSIYAIGGALNGLLRKAMKLNIYSNTSPMQGVFNDAMIAIGKLTADDITDDDILEAMRLLFNVAGTAGGLPVDGAENMLYGAKDIADDDILRGILRFYGASKKLADKKASEWGAGSSGKVKNKAFE